MTHHYIPTQLFKIQGCAIEKQIPQFLFTNFLFQRNNAQVIADSLINLKQKGLIFAPEDDPHISAELKRQGAKLEQPLEEAEPRKTKKAKKAKQEHRDGAELGEAEKKKSKQDGAELEKRQEHRDGAELGEAEKKNPKQDHWDDN